MVSSESGKPIEGTYVFNETSGSYSFTSEVGKFTILKATFGDIVRFGGIGYETHHLTVDASHSISTLQVKLKVKSVQLSEVK